MGVYGSLWDIPSLKRLHGYGKSPGLMGKHTISPGPFSTANCYPLVNANKKLWKDPLFLLGKLTLSMAMASIVM